MDGAKGDICLNFRRLPLLTAYFSPPTTTFFSEESLCPLALVFFIIRLPSKRKYSSNIKLFTARKKVAPMRKIMYSHFKEVRK
jgi:hypothetical protein